MSAITLQQNLKLQQKLSPQQIQVIKMLEYPTVELEERIRRETGTPADKALGGATLGIKNMMQARRIVLVAKGKNKAAIVKRMLEGPVTTAVPASILQLHPHCEFLLDEAAASLLTC